MRDFAHTLAPIGFAYVLAHYFSLLIWQSQAMVYLASDPLGNGTNLLGTDSYMIHYGIVSYAAIWYVQVSRPARGPRRRPDARPRPRARDLPRPAGGAAQPVLDAGGDGGVHELRVVAALGGGDVRVGYGADVPHAVTRPAEAVTLRSIAQPHPEERERRLPWHSRCLTAALALVLIALAAPPASAASITRRARAGRAPRWRPTTRSTTRAAATTTAPTSPESSRASPA